mmetsp:Transcript_18596/g.74240  ORF Transcript_18596/g.74240 Transcript_18596/m.74240 type:complete len:252 (-) Transcript_18596:1063-1818(-)
MGPRRRALADVRRRGLPRHPYGAARGHPRRRRRGNQGARRPRDARCVRRHRRRLRQSGLRARESGGADRGPRLQRRAAVSGRRRLRLAARRRGDRRGLLGAVVRHRRRRRLAMRAPSAARDGRRGSRVGAARRRDDGAARRQELRVHVANQVRPPVVGPDDVPRVRPQRRPRRARRHRRRHRLAQHAAPGAEGPRGAAAPEPPAPRRGLPRAASPAADDLDARAPALPEHGLHRHAALRAGASKIGLSRSL